MRRSARTTRSSTTVPTKLSLKSPIVSEDEVENDNYEEDPESEPSEVPNSPPLSPKVLKKRGRKPRPREPVSMAGGTAPVEHSRLSSSLGNKKRFRFRQPAVSNQKTTVFKIQDYLQAVKKGYLKFCETLAGEGIIEIIANCKANDWIKETPDENNLSKWLNRSSVRIDVQSTFPETDPMMSDKIFLPENDNSMKMFTSQVFEYSLDEKDHELSSVLVDSVLKDRNLQKNENVHKTLSMIEKEDGYRQKKAQALFCGGPLLAIKACPQKAKDGSEVVAIVTVADEIEWKHGSNTPSYIQFWKFYASDLGKNATLWYLLKLEEVGTIADMAWCPLYTEDIIKNSTFSGKIDKNILGHLAVTTDYGKILVYRIDKEMPKSTCNTAIYSTEPILVLQQPVLTIKDVSDDLAYEPVKLEIKEDDDFQPKEEPMDVDTSMNETKDSINTTLNKSVSHKKAAKGSSKKAPKKRKSRKSVLEEDDEADDETYHDFESEEEVEIFIDREVLSAPMTCVFWPPYDSGKFIVAVSATGWVLIWDLTREDPTQASDWLFDEMWESAPTTAALIGDNIMVVAFPTCKLMYYDMESKTKVYEDSTVRSIGCSIHAEQMTFPGIFSYDIVKQIPEPDAQQYYCSAYQVLDLTHETGLTMQPLNRHVGQCLHLGVSPLSGIVGSVGMDGRLVHSFTGRLAPRGSVEDYACNNHRPVLQVVRKTKFVDKSLEELVRAVEGQELSKEAKMADKPLMEYDDVVNNSWVEVRLGDAALVDQVNSATSKVFVEKATFNRRLECLMRIEFSRHDGGVCITGGEAGIVFIVPTSL